MGKKLICCLLVLSLGLVSGCLLSGSSVRQGTELKSAVDASNVAANLGVDNDLAFKQGEVEEALPDMRDLPIPETLKHEGRARRYTGIIKNKTNVEVTVPAGDSGATLVIPAHGFIEYTSWARRFDLTAYYNGKPFYCMKIFANPRNYPFMCKKYDFMIEIVKGESLPPKKRYKKRKKIPGGVEALG